MRRKRGHKGNLLPLLLVFLVGLTIFLYPTLNSYFTGKRMGSSVESFFGTAPTDAAPDDLLPTESIPETEPPAPYPEVLELLEQYNRDIYADGQAKLNSLAATEQAGVLFCVSGQQGDMFGVISVPGIELEMPLYLGATEAHMAEGAAQLGQTSIPIGGENTNAVIAGHRGYNGAPYFRYVPELQIHTLLVFLFPGGIHRFACFSRFCCGAFFILRGVGDPVTTNQKPVGVDPKGRTGDERTQVLSSLQSQIGGVMRQNSVDLVNLVGKDFIQNFQIEGIPNFQLVQVGKHLLTGETGVAGENGVGAAAANGQGTANEMTDTPVERFFLRTMVNGQGYCQLRDMDIAHGSGAGEV